MPLEPAVQPFRVLIVQDIPASASQQRTILGRIAGSHGLPTATTVDDLRRPAERIIEDHLRQRLWDWLILDLLISPTEDHQPLQSSGMNLLRRIRDRGLFHGYRREVAAAAGVRCVAVYSATLDKLGPRHREVRDELGRCGVSEAHLYQPGQMRDVAHDICDELRGA